MNEENYSDYDSSLNFYGFGKGYFQMMQTNL